jgi:hypothetical protein
MDISQILRKLADVVEATPQADLSGEAERLIASMRSFDPIIEGDLSEIATDVQIVFQPSSKTTLKSLQSSKGGLNGIAVDPKLVNRLLADEKALLKALEDPKFAAKFLLDPLGAVAPTLKDETLVSELRAARLQHRPIEDAVVHMTKLTTRVEWEVK